MFETPGPEPGTTQEKKGGKKAFEGSAQLQAGAGNEIDPATAFEEVTRTDFVGGAKEDYCDGAGDERDFLAIGCLAASCDLGLKFQNFSASVFRTSTL